MSARDRGEIRVAQFQLDGPCLEGMLPQTPSHHFGKPRQRGFELLEVGGIFVEGVLVADRFRSLLFADFGVEPAARIESARFSCKRHAPLPEALLEEALIE